MAEGIEELAVLEQLMEKSPAEAARRLEAIEGLESTDAVKMLRDMQARHERLGHLSADHASPDFTTPDFMTPDFILDSEVSEDYAPNAEERLEYGGRIVVRNAVPIVQTLLDDAARETHALEHPEDKNFDPNPGVRENPESNARGDQEDTRILDQLPFSSQELRRLHRYTLISKRVTHQTGKGKIHSFYVLLIVGNGNGLVGLGAAKDEEVAKADEKAFIRAVRNMDYVERYENRTLWTEMNTKYGATRVVLRPRPVGFGLATNPYIHQVLKAAGIKDASAKVWGSRNPISVIRATLRMIQAGNAPLMMGDGIGGPGVKQDKGSGARGKETVERERGRRLVDLRTH